MAEHLAWGVARGRSAIASTVAFLGRRGRTNSAPWFSAWIRRRTVMMRSALCVAQLGLAWAGSEPNPPKWPASVSVFNASMPAADITARVNAVYNENGGRKDNGQFSPDRYALLFMPGTYDVDVPVGYYTQVLGLGESPTDVVFTGDRGVYSEEGDYDIDIGALDSFWRGAFARSTERGSHAIEVILRCLLTPVTAAAEQALRTSRPTLNIFGPTQKACSGRFHRHVHSGGSSSRTT